MRANEEIILAKGGQISYPGLFAVVLASTAPPQTRISQMLDPQGIIVPSFGPAVNRLSLKYFHGARWSPIPQYFLQ